MTDTVESMDPGALLFAPHVAASPQETYDTLRRQCPVARSDFAGMTSIYISRYEDVCWALRHPEYFTSESDAMELGEQPLLPLQVDPPRHTKYRRLLNPRFLPREIGRSSPTCALSSPGSSTPSPTGATATSTRSSPPRCRRGSSWPSWASR